MGGPGDDLNRAAWADARTVEIFLRRSGFVCAGEARVMRRLSQEVKGERILDIGVGGGRTTEFLRQLTTGYLGIDYLEELVGAARQRFPGTRFELMDARDLSALPAAQFGAAVFSLNGLDGMSHGDRAKVLSEVHRVLRPGGWFAYSTHNLAFALIGDRWRPDPRRTLRHPRAAARFAIDTARRCWRGWRLRDELERGDGWATLVSDAYGHEVVWHHVDLEELLRELTVAELDCEIEVCTADGRDARTGLVEPEATRLAHPSSPDLHVLARKAPHGTTPPASCGSVAQLELEAEA